jgi:MFS family permease
LRSIGQSIATLLVGTAALYLGNGLLITLLPIRAQFEAFSTTAIGLMGGAFFAGFALGCVIGPPIVKQVGHIRCFAGFARALLRRALHGGGELAQRAVQ